jgi:hypothetical protein
MVFNSEKTEISERRHDAVLNDPSLCPILSSEKPHMNCGRSPYETRITGPRGSKNRYFGAGAKTWRRSQKNKRLDRCLCLLSVASVETLVKEISR